jgi:nucleoside deoxyribosyltransferase
MKVYIAAPFFTPDQLRTVSRIETLLSSFPGIEMYSPRKDGVLGKMQPEERAAATQKIFDLNCLHISTAQMVLAVIDGRDVGVMWELGFAFAKKVYTPIDIISYTDADYGLNVMIRHCVDAHVHGIDELERLLLRAAKWKTRDYADFQNFDPAVT